MEIELKTTSLKEIIKKCESSGLDVNDVKITYKICEDITAPDEPYVKLFLKTTKRIKQLKIPKGNKVYTVAYTDPNRGYKGAKIYYTITAKNEENAKDKAMDKADFTKYISTKEYHEKYLVAYESKNYDEIGKTRFHEGDERL